MHAAHLSDDAETPPTVTVQTKFGRVRLVLQIGILTLLSFLAAYVILLSDRHNDGRYVTLETYEANRRADEALRAQIDAETRRRLDEIRDDVKTLVRRGQQPVLRPQMQIPAR